MKTDLDDIMMCYRFVVVFKSFVFHIMLFSIIIFTFYICCGRTKVRNSIQIIVCAQINNDVKVKIVDFALAASL